MTPYATDGDMVCVFDDHEPAKMDDLQMNCFEGGRG